MSTHTRPAPKYDEAVIDELFGDLPVEKVGFFSRIKKLFRTNFAKEKIHVEAEDIEAYSKFKQFYEELETEDPTYLPMRQASTLCDDALRVATQRLKISARLNTISNQLSELDAFINLTDEEINDLKKMLERFVAMAGERSILLEKLSDYDSSLVDIESLASDARDAIPSIKDAEKHQRALRLDIGYLTGEKEELAFERVDIQNSLSFIYKMTVGVIGVFFVILFALLFMFFNTTINVFIPATIFVLLVMGFVVVVNIFRFRVIKELRNNTKKQHRAVELLNKKSVVYAYYTNYLRFCYKKYKANNARTLENNLNDLESYRHLANRIDTVRSLMYETETTIERFVREKKLGGVKSTVEGFAKTINLDDKRRRFTDLNTEREGAEKSLAELDRRHEEIWNTLTKLKKIQPAIEVVIENYMKEAEALFAAHEKKEEEPEPRPIWQLFDIFAEGAEKLTESATEVLTDIEGEKSHGNSENL
ncbi:MAG: hypothetical protein FWE05_10330 [Defluviitaleaceae bacterium]|nr:hypothetical protein [Defluviitaleaceae bacterium]